MTRPLSFAYSLRISMALVVFLSLVGDGGGEQSVQSLDARRALAQRLMSEGRTKDALVIFGEIVGSDTAEATDFIAIANANAALSQKPQAEYWYWRALGFRGGTSELTTRERSLVLAKLRKLDSAFGPTDDGIRDFLGKLDKFALSEASAGDGECSDRLLVLWMQAYSFHGLASAPVEIQAAAPWQSSNFTLQSGHRYRLIATGTWKVAVGSTAVSEVTANGLDQRSTGGVGGLGSLIGRIGESGDIFPLGRDLTFTAPATGILNCGMARDARWQISENVGSVTVQLAAL